VCVVLPVTTATTVDTVRAAIRAMIVNFVKSAAIQVYYTFALKSITK
jgi:hypothetical protein